MLVWHREGPRIPWLLHILIILLLLVLGGDITDTLGLRKHLEQYPDADKKLAERLRRVPSGEIMTPDQIARAILYFSCEDSAGITATSLVADGGYLAAAEWDSGQ